MSASFESATDCPFFLCVFTFFPFAKFFFASALKPLNSITHYGARFKLAVPELQV